MDPAPTLKTIELASLDDTDRLGERLARYLRGGTCVGLVGTLGAGKTRLAQAIIAAHGIGREAVTSPTFTLVRTYACGDLTLHHLDAYRIKDEDEFFELGVEELWEDDAAVVLVEWADRVAGCLPPSTLWIEIEWTDTERRVVTFRGDPDIWCEEVAEIAVRGRQI